MEIKRAGIRQAVIVGISALALAGCGNSTKTPTVGTAPPVSVATQSATASAKPTPAQNAADGSTATYITAFSRRDDPDVMRAELANVEGNSPAWVYLSHLANVAESALDAGKSYPAEVTTPIGDGSFKVCDPAGSTGAADPTTCVTLSDFKVNPAGQLVDLTVDKQALSPRLTLGSGEAVSSGGAKFTFLTAYKSVKSNALLVTVKVAAGAGAVKVYGSQSTYRDPDGKQRTAASSTGASEVGAMSNTIVTLIFPGVKTGGQVTLEGSTGANYDPIKAVINVG